MLFGEVKLPRAEPVEEVLGLAGNIGREQAQRLRIAEVGTGQADGDFEMGGWLDVEDAIDILEMEPEELVEEEVGIDGEIGAVPPEPVAAFGGVDFPPGFLGAFGRDGVLREMLDEKVAGLLQPFPGLVFLGIADPDVKIAADPGTGVKVAGLDLRRVRVEVIAETRGFQFGRFGQGAVEGGEKRFAAVGEGFPGVFAVEREGGDAAIGRGDLGDVLEVVDEMETALGVSLRAASKPMKSERGRSRKSAWMFFP